MAVIGMRGRAVGGADAPARSGVRDAGLPIVCARWAARYPAGEFEVTSTAAVMADGDGSGEGQVLTAGRVLPSRTCRFHAV